MTATQVYEQVQKQSSNELLDLESYLPLVKRIAYHLKGRLPDSVFVDDLIQSGIIGLIEAMQKFNSNQGASFETYAGIRIRGAMLDEIRKGDWTPRSVHRKSREVSEAIHRVEVKVGREAKDEEIALELGVEITEYHHILQDTCSAQLLSIDEPDHEELSEGKIIGGSQNPFAEISESGFQQSLANEIGNLPEKEKLVMALYYDEELNLKEIGEVLEVSESRVSQIHSQAIKKEFALEWLIGCKRIICISLVCELIVQINQGMKILIVDDFSTMRTIVKDLLRELGFSHFHEADDGDKAWEMIQTGDYDFIVSDWNMPNMTGLELLKKVRNEPRVKNTPFLLISAEAKRSQIIEATEAGVDDYIVKPFTAATLNEKIYAIFERISKRL